MNIGELREHLVNVMDLGGGGFGENLHESKDVVIRLGEFDHWHLANVAVSFVEGRVVFALIAGGVYRTYVVDMEMSYNRIAALHTADSDTEGLFCRSCTDLAGRRVAFPCATREAMSSVTRDDWDGGRVDA